MRLSHKATLTITFLALALLGAGCGKKAEPAPAPQPVAVEQQGIVKKTALVSFPYFFCSWTELSEPVAYFQFAYQENGEIKYVRTKTTCDDLIKIGVADNASTRLSLLIS